jgi:hypothetical protein
MTTNDLIEKLILLVLDAPHGEQALKKALEELQFKRISNLPLVCSAPSIQPTTVEVVRNILNNSESLLFEKFQYNAFYISELRKWYARNFELSAGDLNFRTNSIEPWWWQTLTKAALSCSVLVKLQGPRGYYKLIETWQNEHD